MTGKVLLLTCICSHAFAALNEPFPGGYAMGNLGTIISENGPGGRSYAFPAAFMTDTFTIGITASGTLFYDDMDNYRERSIISVAGSAWYASGRLTLKAGISNFDALGAYLEQSGFLSAAVPCFHGIRIGTEFTGTRIIPGSSSDGRLTLGEAGASAWIPAGKLFLSASVSHIIMKPTGSTGADPPLRIICGIHTAHHALGAQGVRIDIVPRLPHPVSFAIGQEFRLFPHASIHAAIASYPFFIAFGVAVFVRSGCMSVAFTNHPVLGWSRGFGAEYGRNPRLVKKTVRK